MKGEIRNEVYQDITTKSAAGLNNLITQPLLLQKTTATSHGSNFARYFTYHQIVPYNGFLINGVVLSTVLTNKSQSLVRCWRQSETLQSVGVSNYFIFSKTKKSFIDDVYMRLECMTIANIAGRSIYSIMSEKI